MLAAPRGLEIHAFDIGADHYALLEFPLEPGVGLPRADSLTPAERTIAALILQGHSNAEIARARGTSARTIANQTASLYRKIGVRSRRELKALERGGTTPFA